MCINKQYYSMKTYKGEWAYVHVRLTLALGGSQRPADLPPGKLAPLFFEYDARWPQNFEVEGTSVSTGGESLFLDLILYHNPRTDCPIWRQFFFYVRIFDMLEICDYNLNYRCTLTAVRCSRTWSVVVWQVWNFTGWKPKKLPSSSLS